MSTKNLKKIYFKALDSVKAKNIVKSNISLKGSILIIKDEKIDLLKKSLYVYSVGKAGYDMAKECEKILAKNIKDGIAISHKSGKLKYIKHITSTHPLVSDKSIAAADKLIKSLSSLKKDDYFIFFLSGGASAMIEKPANGMSLENFKKLSTELLTSGIDITELNEKRKENSDIKGGKLANLTKANGVTLVLSDVIEDDLNTIGSAPMNNGKIPHHIIGNNKIALENAKKYISKKYKKTETVTTTLDKNSKEATKEISKLIRQYDKKYDEFCLLLGGETTTIVKGNGKGGRNQELALRLMIELEANEKISFLCAGSDGIDGNSPATGAFIDNKLYKKYTKKKLDPKQYLENSDSYTFFNKLGYDFTIGATGTNVMDFIVILKK